MNYINNNKKSMIDTLCKLGLMKDKEQSREVLRYYLEREKEIEKSLNNYIALHTYEVYKNEYKL